MYVPPSRTDVVVEEMDCLLQKEQGAMATGEHITKDKESNLRGRQGHLQ